MLKHSFIATSLIATALSSASVISTLTPYDVLGMRAVAQSNNVDEIYEKALQSFHDRKIDETIIRLKNALQLNKGHLPSRILLAETFIAQGNGMMAENELNFARDKGADKDRLVVLFGQAYLLQSKNRQLIEQILPGNRGRVAEAEIHHLRGQAYLAMRKMVNADKAFKTAIKISPDFHAPLLGRAQVAAARGKVNQAMAYINDSLAIHPTNPTAWIMKSKIYKRKKQPQKALEAINRALKISPNHFGARLTRAALLVDEKDFVNAEIDVDLILTAIPNEPQAKYFKAIIKAGAGNEKDSKTNLSEVADTLRNVPVEIMQANPTYYYLAGVTNYQLDNLIEARNYLHTYLRLEPSDISAKRVLGALELQSGNPAEANSILQNAYHADPSNSTILTLLGMSLLELGDTSKANKLFERVVEMLPESSQSLTNLAKGKMAEGSFQTAIKTLLKAEQHNLNSLDIKIMLAKAYRNSRQFKKSLAIITELKNQFPDNSYFHQFHGSIIGLNGNHIQARKSLQKALEVDPNNIEALIQLSRMSVMEDDFSGALKPLEAKLLQIPKSVRLMMEIGDVELAQKNNEKALFWYKKAYAVNGSSHDTLIKLVQAFINKNDLPSALTTATEFSNRFPKDSLAFEVLGDTYLTANNISEAISAYKIYATHAFNKGKALEKLAEVQMANNNIEPAISSLRKAIAWDRDYMTSYVKLFHIYVGKKNWLKSEEMLSHIRRLTQGLPTYNLLAGNFHLARGNYEKAEIQYRAAGKFGENPLITLGLYETYKASNQQGMALFVLEQWYRKYPTDLPIALTLGQTYLDMGQIKKSAIHHETLIKKFPTIPVLLNNAANIQFKMGNINRAIKYAKKAVKLNPNSPDFADTLAWIHSRNGHPEKALPILRGALIKRYNSPEVKFHLAMTLNMLGRRDEALVIMAEVVQTGGNFSDIEQANKTLRSWISERN